MWLTSHSFTVWVIPGWGFIFEPVKLYCLSVWITSHHSWHPVCDAPHSLFPIHPAEVGYGSSRLWLYDMSCHLFLSCLSLVCVSNLHCHFSGFSSTGVSGECLGWNSCPFPRFHYPSLLLLSSLYLLPLPWSLYTWVLFLLLIVS